MAANSGDEVALSELLRRYRHLNLRELQQILQAEHGVRLSQKKLSRLSLENGVRRRGASVSRDQVKTILQTLLDTSSVSAGYRAMYLKLKMEYSLDVRRSTVMEIMQEIDEDGVSFRKKRSIKRRDYSSAGPNYLWHIDGYDKLKKFGFAIHACIDGYSRKVIWLEIGPSNSDPKVVGKYYLDTIRDLKGVPNMIRGDRGTENVVIERLQRCFVASHISGNNRTSRSFLYGKSCLNQRIERFWRSLRDGSLEFYINFFSQLEREGIFSTADDDHIEAVRYCFMPLMRQKLNEFKQHWNYHFIRTTRRNAIGGKPAILYSAGGRQYLYDVLPECVKEAENFVTEVPDVSKYFEEFANATLATWIEPPNATAEEDLQEGIDKLKTLLAKLQ